MGGLELKPKRGRGTKNETKCFNQAINVTVRMDLDDVRPLHGKDTTFYKSTREVICCVQIWIIRNMLVQQTRSCPGNGYSSQTISSLLGRYFHWEKDFNLQSESQSHLFTSEICVNSLLTWRQTAAVPQDSELKERELKPAEKKTGPRGTNRLLFRSGDMVDLCLRRPDKGQLCAHYVCSVSAGSRGSEALKGRLNVLTRESWKRCYWKESVKKTAETLLHALSNRGLHQTYTTAEHMKGNFAKSKCLLARLSPTELCGCYVSPVCLSVSSCSWRDLTPRRSKMPSNSAADQHCIQIPLSRKIEANQYWCCGGAACCRIALCWLTWVSPHFGWRKTPISRAESRNPACHFLGLNSLKNDAHE